LHFQSSEYEGEAVCCLKDGGMLLYLWVLVAVLHR
jgi:hypothetical protein